MAGFLHRVVAPIAPPHPAPFGPATFHVETSGADGDNDCVVEASPCRTIEHALTFAVDEDTIAIGPGTFVESGLKLDYELTIRGDPSGGTTIDAGGAPSSIFDISYAPIVGTTDVRHITISHLTLTGSTGGLGAIDNSWTGVVTISGSTIRDNTSIAGGGVTNNGDLTIVGSTITGNAANDPNSGGGNGGAIYGWFLSDTTVVDSTISSNSASRAGGGIYTDGRLTVVNSTIDGNAAVEGGGGIANINGWPGSAISIVNSTISGNSSSSGGGGIASHGPLDLRNAIVAGNTAPIHPEVSGTIDSQLASIVVIPAGLTLADILDPAGLADHGGPTQTIGLSNVAKNPAKGKGDAPTCAAAPVSGLDQRGLSRTPPCDIGAYELQP